jgi:hypothetical protein
MKQVILDTAQANTPHEVYALLEREGLQAGDSIKVLEKPLFDQKTREAIYIFVMVAVMWFLSRKHKSEQLATELLDDVFKKYNSAEDLERELQEEFSISVSKEDLDTELEDWRRFGLVNLGHAYSVDEPDISSIPVREPNPDYKPWKPGT